MARLDPRIPAALAAALLAATGAAGAEGAEPPAGPVRVAVVDMDRVMAESDAGKVEQARIDRMKGEKTTLLNNRQKELETLEQEIRNASLSWSDERREAQMRQYEDKRIELRRLNEDATRDIQQEFNRALAKLQRAALEVTGGIGRERGYTLILEKHSLPVLYASDAVDITDVVIERLNAAARAAGPPGSGGRR